uniref:KH domain-containing protein At4g18375 n=1 Tax=Rhizophora mucronata TaxID=61149 RepID=A0A2P2JFA9_RHIMU
MVGTLWITDISVGTLLSIHRTRDLLCIEILTRDLLQIHVSLWTLPHHNVLIDVLLSTHSLVRALLITNVNSAENLGGHSCSFQQKTRVEDAQNFHGCQLHFQSQQS